MSNYLYFQSYQFNLIDRFNLNDDSYEDIRGLSIWREHLNLLSNYLVPEFENQQTEILEQVRNLTKELFPDDGDSPEFYAQNTKSPGELILIHLLFEIQKKEFRPLENPCPRIFISHRQSDWLYGLTIAQIAKDCGFEYWLDVLDPLLTHVTTSAAIPATLVPLLTACIIEMALINCSHVIACMTPNSRGSLWQPYEYGRIANVSTNFRKAGAWPHPNLLATDFPEYMYLGEIVKDKAMIQNWLVVEYARTNTKICGITKDNVLDDYWLPELPEIKNLKPGTKDFPYQLDIINAKGEKTHYPVSDITEERALLSRLTTVMSEKKQFGKAKLLLNSHIEINMATNRPITVGKPAKFKKKS